MPQGDQSGRLHNLGLPEGKAETDKPRVRKGFEEPRSVTTVATIYMQTCYPKCSTIVKSTDDKWELINSSCVDLVGTEWDGKPEYCPLLSVVVQPEVTLPGVAVRAKVRAEIESAKIKSLRNPSTENESAPDVQNPRLVND